MVHHRGPGPPPLGRAHPAPRLPDKLGRPQVIRPDGLAVPVVVCRACLSCGPPRWRSVLVTPAVSGKLWAARVPAGAQGSPCHGLSPPRKAKKKPEPLASHLGYQQLGLLTALALQYSRSRCVLLSRGIKKARANEPSLLGLSSARAFVALALRYAHCVCALAPAAVYHQPVCSSIRQDPEQLPRPLAGRAIEPTRFHWHKCTTFDFVPQEQNLTFYTVSRYATYISSQGRACARTRACATLLNGRIGSGSMYAA